MPLSTRLFMAREASALLLASSVAIAPATDRSSSSGATRLARPIFSASPALSQEPNRRISRSEEHTSELQSLMRISYAVFCLKKKNQPHQPLQMKHKINTQ